VAALLLAAKTPRAPSFLRLRFARRNNKTKVSLVAKN
jgi:hypothetical protein